MSTISILFLLVYGLGSILVLLLPLNCSSLKERFGFYNFLFFFCLVFCTMPVGGCFSAATLPFILPAFFIFGSIDPSSWKLASLTRYAEPPSLWASLWLPVSSCTVSKSTSIVGFHRNDSAWRGLGLDSPLLADFCQGETCRPTIDGLSYRLVTFFCFTDRI